MVGKLGITGMDSASESALRTAFEQARPRLGGRWELVPEAEADHVVVDMDSMYGPMSWIRLHAAGKQVIGLTESPRTQADHRLARPFDTDAVASLLGSIADAAGTTAKTAGAPEATTQPMPAVDAPPSAATPAPAPADQLPEEQPPTAADEEVAAPAEPAAALEPASAQSAAGQSAPPLVADAGAPEANQEPGPATAEPVPTTPARDPVFADWLAPGALAGRWRYRRDGVDLLLDADARVYHGPALLKPLAAAFEGTVRKDAFEPVEAAAWADAIAGLGDAQPLARLQWLGGLLAGKGRLLPGNDAQGQYRLLKWPQTEREYPKHFRIATAMMKGPATVAEVAAASGVTEAEVADFFNANLATGYAELVPPAPPAPSEPPRPAGLLGRLRGR